MSETATLFDDVGTTTTAEVPTANGAAQHPETVVTPVPTLPLGERPKSKTAAARSLLEEGHDDTRTIIKETHTRWGYDLNGCDVANARKSIQDARDKSKEERRRKRQDKAAASMTPPEVAPNGLDTRDDDFLWLDALCVRRGITFVETSLVVIRRDAQAKLGIQ